MTAPLPSRPPHAGDVLDHALFRWEQAEDLLRDADELYAPHPATPAHTTVDEWGSAWLSRLDPCRLVFAPLWVVGVAVVHAVCGLLMLGGLMVATVLLALAGWVVVDTHLGVPVLGLASGCVGVLAAVGTVSSVIRSFRQHAVRTPW